MPCSKRMDRCSIRCLHYQHVLSYQLERIRQEAEMEDTAKGYATEERDFRSTIITFKTYLEQTKGWNRHE